jgi:hypothetical protein
MIFSLYRTDLVGNTGGRASIPTAIGEMTKANPSFSFPYKIMNPSSALYASPKIARELTKVFGKEVSDVKVTMRESKDVPRFVRKISDAHKKTARSRLKFG